MAEARVFMIIGKSFSGKDTLLNNILNDKEFCERTNLTRLVRYTTRKQRPTEVNGVDYHFITYSEYEERFKDQKDVIVTMYDSKFGLLHYITDLSNLEDDKNYIVVADPESIKEYKQILGNRLCVIYLITPNWELLKRFGNRDDNEEYADLKYKEIYRRLIDDTIKFGKKSNEFMANCNCIINLGSDVFLDNIKSYINKFVSEKWYNIGILLNKDGYIIYNNAYNGSKDNSEYYKLMNGSITLHNGDIYIHAEDELYTINPSRFDNNFLIFKSV